MKWPPLIDAGHLPWWVVARDALATLLAWALLLYFIRDMAWMAAYWIATVFGIELPKPWAPGKMFRDVVPFLKVVALLVAWLVVFAVARWRLLTDRQHASSQPEPLDPTLQARAFGLSADALARLRHASSATVDGIDPATSVDGASIVIAANANDPDG